MPLYDDFETQDSLGRADLRLSAQLLGQPINHTSLPDSRRAALARLVEAGLIEEDLRGDRWVYGVGSYRLPLGDPVASGIVRSRVPDDP